MLADGGHEIGIHQRALEEIDLTKEFHFAMVNRSQGRVSSGKSVGRKQPLISHVVNGEDRGHLAERRVFRVLGVQQNRNQRRLPVVAMKNCGTPRILEASSTARENNAKRSALSG